MRVLKYLGIAFLGTVIMLFMVGLFLPKEFVVEREVVIYREKAAVFAYVKLLKNQDVYSSWSQKDPNAVHNYEGEDGTVGFTSYWESDHRSVGKGSQQILIIKEGERIDTKLRMEIPYEAEDQAYIITEEADEDATLVRWGFSGSMAYPLNILQLFMPMEKMVGKDLEIGLANLKVILEQNEEVPSVPDFNTFD
jgi:hypothetical protein